MKLEGEPEVWLQRLGESMKSSLKSQLTLSLSNDEKTSVEPIAEIEHVTSQIEHTARTTLALQGVADGDKDALKVSG